MFHLLVLFLRSANHTTAKSPQSLELYSRWVQLGAASPLMENGGNNEHRPWMWDAPGSTTVTDMYRTLVSFHHSILPYLLTTGSNALDTKTSSLIFTQAESLIVKDYSYRLGPDIFVQPVVNDGVREINVTFPGCPAGSAQGCVARWQSIYDSSTVYTSDKVWLFSVPITQTPIFLRKGSVLPLSVDANTVASVEAHRRNIRRELRASARAGKSADQAADMAAELTARATFVTQMGDASSADAITLLHMLDPAVAEGSAVVRPNKATAFTVRHSFAPSSASSPAGSGRACGSLKVTVTATDVPIVLALKGVLADSSASAVVSQVVLPAGRLTPTVLSAKAASSLASARRAVESSKLPAYSYDTATGTLFVRPIAQAQGVVVTVDQVCVVA